MPRFPLIEASPAPGVAQHERDKVTIIGGVLDASWNGEVDFVVPIPPGLSTAHRAWTGGTFINGPVVMAGSPPFIRCGPLAAGVGRHYAQLYDGTQGNWETLFRCWPEWPVAVPGLVPVGSARMYPMAFVMDAILRKVAVPDTPGSYSGFGLSACLGNSSSNNIAYPADRQFPVAGILGDAAGGFALATVDTPDGATAVATDRDPSVLDPGAIPAIVAPGAGWFRASLKFVPAGPTSQCRMVGYINGVSIGSIAGAARRCRGAGTGSLTYATELAWLGAGHNVTFGGTPIDFAMMRTYYTYDLTETLG